MTSILTQPPPDPSRFRSDAEYDRALYKWTYEAFRALSYTGAIVDRDIVVNGADEQLGSEAVDDAAALTVTAITDNTGGTPGGTIEDVTAVFSQTILNNNMAELALQVNALAADVTEIRNQLNALLGELRMTNGCGVLSD